MNFEDKLYNAHKEAATAGIWEANYSPPIYRLARLSGFKARPPHYNSFLVNLLVTSLWFGCAWGIFMWLAIWRTQGTTFIGAVTVCIVVGVFFGLIMAAYYTYSGKKKGLSTWEEV